MAVASVNQVTKLGADQRVVAGTPDQRSVGGQRGVDEVVAIARVDVLGQPTGNRQGHGVIAAKRVKFQSFDSREVRFARVESDGGGRRGQCVVVVVAENRQLVDAIGSVECDRAAVEAGVGYRRSGICF